MGNSTRNSLRDQYELVNINERYAYVYFGNMKMIIDKETGYINATKICKEAGKEFKHWLANGSSKKLIHKLKNIIQKNPIYQITTGSRYEAYLRGSYVHQLLITPIAHWVSPIFALKISIWIEEWKSYENNNETYWNEISKIKPSKNNQKELKIKNKLNRSLKGETEVETSHGLIDILTENEIIEIKTSKLYKHALGQILAYGVYYPNHQKVIYLFDLQCDFNLKKVRRFYQKYDVELRTC